MKRIIFAITRINSYVGLVLLSGMVFFIVIDVCLRSFFDRPISGSVELIEMMMIGVVFSFLPYTMSVKGHVSIDLIASFLSKTFQSIIDRIVYLFGFILWALISWQTFIHAEANRQAGILSGTLYIPEFPLILVAAFGSALIALVLLTILIQSFTEETSK